MRRYLLIPMKRLVSKLVPGATKSELGSPSQEPSPNGGQNCSPTNPLSPGQPVALWSSFIVHKTKAHSQLVGHCSVTNVMQHTTNDKRPLAFTAAFCRFFRFQRAIYEVTSHQFLLISLKIKNAGPFSSSRSHSSLIPICLPFVENSLCASSTSSGVAIFSVKRFATDK